MGGHVAVIVFPFSSHASSLLSLVYRLAAAAPNVKFSFLNTAWSNASTFSNKQYFDNVKAYNVWDGVAEGEAAPPLEEHVGLFLKAAPANFKRAMDDAVKESGRKISCLLGDAFLWFSAEMAEELHVPWLSLRTGPPVLIAHLNVDLIRETIGIGGIAGREEEPINFIPGFSVIRLGDLPEGIIFGELELPFPVMLHKMGHILPKSAAVVANSFEELDPNITKYLKSKLQNLLSVGPFCLTLPPSASNISEDEHGCLAWLDNHKPASVAYIAFGTMFTLQPNELVALAEALLEASEIPFLWALKGNIEEKLPKGFVEKTSRRGKIVPWTPQLKVLQHASVGVFVTHCGWNSAMESVAGGVPMICRPIFADQRLNARMIQDVWKIGVIVKGGVITKNGIREDLELILLLDKGKKIRDNVGVFKELAIKAVGPNGSSDQNFKTLLEMVTKF